MGNIMKKIAILLLVICLLFTVAGCAKLISTEYQTVEVKIVDEYYRGAYTQPMIVGKIITVRVVPAKYNITVEYNGIEYVLSGSETYYKYKNHVGEYVNGVLEIHTYDDGSIKTNIISLE